MLVVGVWDESPFNRVAGRAGAIVTVIRVSESAALSDGSFGVRVAFDDAADYEATVGDPADAAAEKLLAWYFEEHLRFPFLDRDLERQAVDELAGYGRSLFGQVLAGAAAHDYRVLRDRSFDGCRLEVTGSAAFHLLHWEALRDPDMDVPLALRLPVTRRVGQLGAQFELPPGRSSLNILLVTARPFGARDVGYRTISRPLLDALRQSSLPVSLDLVRPGTWEALRTHLRARAEQDGTGWYQVIHFDLHGGFNEFTELEQARDEGRLLFGGAAVPPFEGRRPFLFFETAQDGKAAPVPAAAVASLLAEHRIPVAVLNACQSAMQGGSEASLAQHLVQAGVPVAVGMAYSVTVTAATRAMPVFYDRLARGADPVAALHAARQVLHDDPGRQAYFGQQVDLQDWVLPVGFRQQPVQLRLRPMDDAEQARFFQREADLGQEPSPEYGFIGRDLDIQAIERGLLTGPDTGQLLVQGMAGAGKSTLLAHLAWWWQRTGLVSQVFRFSYEDRAWTASQIIREIRAKLLTRVEQARGDAMSGPAQLEQAAQLLRADRHLLILDNAESITATPAAIPHALSAAQQAQIRGLLTRLRGGRTLVLIGSREVEEWLAPGTFGQNVYPLPGLDPQAASTLTDRILRRHKAERWLGDDTERKALNDLVELLGGYPLPMTVVLPVLAAAAPSQVLAELKAGGAGADPTEKIIRAIEYSHGKLDPTLQSSLLLLAPFTAAIPPGSALDYYRDQLLGDGSVQVTGAADLARAVAETVRVGLAVPHPQLPDYVQVQPVLPYFLRNRLRGDSQLQAATAQAHYRLYTALGSQLYQLLTETGDSEARVAGQAATRAEYANLTTALAYGLQTSQPISDLIAPLDEYLDQTKQHTTRRKLLDDAIATYPQPASDTQYRGLAHLHNLAGGTALAQHRLEDAKVHYETELQLLQAIGDREDQGGAYHQLGRVAQEQRRFAEAEANYRQALDIYLEFGNRHAAARTYGQLGRVAEDQERFADAEANYRQALDIFMEFGDRYGVAGTYYQLAAAAGEQQRFTDAEASYRQALDIFMEFGDRHAAAGIYHQLGIVAEAQERFAEAEASYRQALDIYLEYGDRHTAASTYHQLGRIAQLQERFDEAEANYRQALDIYLETDERSASITATVLGLLLSKVGRHTDAATMLLDGALLWYQLAGGWDNKDLQHLKRERQLISEAEFRHMIAAKVPPDVQEAFVAAIDNAEDI